MSTTKARMIRSDIIRSATNSKLQNLREEKLILDAFQQTLTSSISEIPSSLTDAQISAETLKITAKHIKDLRLTDTYQTRAAAENALAFLDLYPGYTPPIDQLEVWHLKLKKEFDLLRNRAEHSAVYADVLQEWFDEKQKEEAETEGAGDAATGGQAGNPKEPKDWAIRDDFPAPKEGWDPLTYLKENKVSGELLSELKKISKENEEWGMSLLEGEYTIADYEVEEAIEFLASDARNWPAEIRSELKILAEQPLLVSELASAYTTRWRDLKHWDWPKEGIKCIPQKHLSGKTRLFLELGMASAIFLQIIGKKWADQFAMKLGNLRAGKSWPKTFELQGLRTGQERTIENILTLLKENTDHDTEMEPIPEPLSEGIARESERRLRKGYLSVMQSLGRTAGESYDMEVGGDTTLLRSAAPMAAMAYGSATAEMVPRRNMAAKAAAPPPPPPRQSGPKMASLDAMRTVTLYTKIINSINTDLAVTKAVAPESDFGVLHTDIKDFGLSVPHDVALSVLKFFGVPEGWLKFFSTYLRLRTRKNNGEISTLDRGTPFGLSISMLINELLLIILDISLVSSSKVYMMRKHDDFWLWSLQPDRIASAWIVMKAFTEQTGLEWNMDKSGYTLVKGEAGTPGVVDVGLPENTLRWGLLELKESGEWVVNQKALDDQVEAMKEELKGIEKLSFLAVVNLWNKYQSYIARNVGAPTKVTGIPHVKLLSTILKDFQAKVLGTDAENVTVYEMLYAHFQRRFPQYEGYKLNPALLIWEAKNGGFQLIEPGLHAIVQLEALKNPVTEKPLPPAFEEVLESDKLVYEKVRKAWEDEQWGENAWSAAMQSNNGRVRSWAFSLKGEKPSFPSETAFLAWVALNSDLWLDEYNDVSESIVVEANNLIWTTQKVLKPFLEEAFGQNTSMLVANQHVPQHAVQELVESVRKMFSAA